VSDERLPVLLAPGREALTASDYVRSVARLADLEPVATPVAVGADRPAAVLAAAAEDERTRLVLAEPHLPLPPSLSRLLVPIGRDPGEGRVVRSWARQAEERGIAVRHLHVLAPDALPVMWAGPGHHAEAWRGALARRYRVVPAGLTVRAGVPADQLRAACADADLVLACWAGDASSQRAATLRSLLAGCPVPVLLVRRIPLAPRAGSGARSAGG
jgi:hypothetical protein